MVSPAVVSGNQRSPTSSSCDIDLKKYLIMLWKGFRMKMSYTSTDFTKSLYQPSQLQPYYLSFAYGQSVSEKEEGQVIELFHKLITVLGNPKKDNMVEFQKRLKKFEPNDTNIEGDNGIEWGLKEQLLNHHLYLEKLNLQQKVHISRQPSTVWMRGFLQVYGVSPYRHLNKFIHEYRVEQDGSQVIFKPRQTATPQTQETSMSEDLVEKLKQDVKKDQGVFTKAKEAIYKVNHLFYSKPEEAEHPLQMMTKFRDGLKQKVAVKEKHILVRDYELESELQLELEGNEFALKTNHFWLRTETMIDPKESESTRIHKQMVLTDVNWVMKGNPWAWVKRFDTP